MAFAVTIFYFQELEMRTKIKIMQTTKQRITAIMVLFSIFSAYLLFTIFNLSVIKHDYYVQKAYDQVTTTSKLVAKRGKIFDSNMNVLATDKTSWRIFVSPKDIRLNEKKSGRSYSKEIALSLSRILNLDEDTLIKKISNYKVLDVTIKAAATESEYRQVIEFIKKGGFEDMVFTEAQSTRFYPEGTLLAHALGFVGSDNQGLFGLEYYYDDLLSGEDGYYAYAKDASGNTLDTEYSTYVAAKDGYSLVTTVDSYVQGELESIIESIRINHGVENRVCGIVMNTNTGAILAMATSSPFDPNYPFVLDDVSMQKLNSSGLASGSEEYSKYKSELLQTMWSNKAVTETYEPGSTFKIITVSAALDLGTSQVTDTFSCNGYRQIGGYRIRCHKVGGHGNGFSLAYGLQMSCNPCMIAVSEKIGSENFYSYVEKFGYFEKSGIDLPGEGTTIFHKPNEIGTTELATASFGQRFKVSIINQLVAISAVANGGKLVRPYIVERVLDSDGKIISDHQTEVRRQVISENVANMVSKILIEGVDGDGGAKNAGALGYDIAAKTGTSQKFDILDENGNSYLRIGSTVAYALGEDSGVSMIIVVDEPTSQVKYGSVVAAPYVSMLYERILPYLEFRSDNDEINTTVDSFVGLAVKEAEKKAGDMKLNYEIIGNGEKIISQTPAAGDVITYPLSKILLYTENGENELVCVPDIIGMSLPDAIKEIINAGLNVKISGNGAISPSSKDKVLEQSIPKGSLVERGTIIIIRAIKEDYED